MVYGDGLEICHRVSQRVLLDTNYNLCVNSGKPVLCVEYQLVLTSLVQLAVTFVHLFRITCRPNWRGERMLLLSGADFT